MKNRPVILFQELSVLFVFSVVMYPLSVFLVIPVVYYLTANV